MVGSSMPLQPLLRRTRKRNQPRLGLPFLILLTVISLAFSAVYILYNSTSAWSASERRRLSKEETLVASLHWGQWNLAGSGSGSRPRPPKILLWTTYFGVSPDGHYGIQAALEKCPVQCLLTENKLELLSADAVAFHMVDIGGPPVPAMPPLRHPNQVWVLYGQESPLNFPVDLTPFAATPFNWTMTYRRDSDVQFQYGRAVPRPRQAQATNSGGTKSKHEDRRNLTDRPNLVCWAVSHCYTYSDRESLARDLRSELGGRLHIYGRCGQLPCPRQDSQSHNCYPLLAPRCKFYLSFENSLCTDYVTEKFYDPLLHDMVPIVYGWAEYNAADSSVAPPQSYINLLEFGTMAELADRLRHLDEHDGEYLRFFDWKRDYDVVIPNTWCELCTKLKATIGERHPERKWYEDVHHWWHHANGSCAGVDAEACRALRASDKPEHWLEKILGLVFQPKI